MEFIYRAMAEENGFPRLGTSATTLGVRIGIDIDVDGDGNVHLPEFQNHDKNGMSCSPTIGDLPLFVIPVEWDGNNKKTKAWRIRIQDLGAELTAQEDGDCHISIGPSRTMKFEDYLEAIQNSAPQWELIIPNEEN